LLKNPLIVNNEENEREYSLVRRHAAWLRQWFSKLPAWQLYIDNDCARLRKNTPDMRDKTRAAIDSSSGSAFSRRRYAMFCLALAAIERSANQTTLGRIAESVMQFIAADPTLQDAGMVFDLGHHEQRRDLVHAVRLLIDLGLLRRVDGNERDFLDRTGAQDALYDIRRSVLTQLLNVSRSPSALEAAAANGLRRRNWEDLNEEPPAITEEERQRRLRTRFIRALIEDPVVYYSDFRQDEQSYLKANSARILQQIREATGLVPEIRQEGIAVVDDGGDVTDVKLPEEGTDGHIGLLLAERLAQAARTAPGVAIAISQVEQHVRELIQIHGTRWRKVAREPGAETQLAHDTLLRLQALRLVQITADAILPLAAIGRYAAAAGPQISNE
jgi:uncharacterized protein (TIGR02678 family)